MITKIGSGLDPEKTTQAYIDSLGIEALEKAAAYSSGSHWLLFAGLVVSAFVTWGIVRLGWLDQLEKKFGASSALGIYCIGVVYTGVSALLSLPFTIYESWFRESSYGRTSQPLSDFLIQNFTSTILTALITSLFFVFLYGLIRKTGRAWWLWSGGLAAAFIAIMMVVGPVYISPLFNEYKPLPEGEVRTEIEKIADKAGIPKDKIFVYDGSRQSENFTANVAGIGGSARIAISDVALDKASLDEVLAVTGHEAGHFVSGHIWRIIAVIAGLMMAGFFLADRSFSFFARQFGSTAQLSSPSGLPVLIFIVSLFSVIGQPVMNGVTRIGELDADVYSLETVGLPDGLASALLKTAEYRDPKAGDLQEFLFFSHPTVEKRILNAMRWKAKKESALRKNKE
ncbi:M48 family metallopeptidase [Temperatibacter marinus]|uniref:M48 family metallopeptidase n=1 Tax=Temperatibacter marinus TaxID=1456591 RepID=A0AA52EH50_9PROT|nr:M48 family metallopeptidase [Temperatibacter marinus]WND03568.1 M48 family metallopeptidase [Temperatibacter marinus]